MLRHTFAQLVEELWLRGRRLEAIAPGYRRFLRDDTRPGSILEDGRILLRCSHLLLGDLEVFLFLFDRLHFVLLLRLKAALLLINRSRLHKLLYHG